MARSGSIPFVTVVVPSYNDKAHIGECLESVVQSDYPTGHLEVLVVDGGSDDGSRDLALDVARRSHVVRVLDNQRRITAAAMNIGIQNSKGDVVIMLSAHSRVAPDFVSESVRCLANTGAACVGGPIGNVAQSFLGKTIALAMSCPFGVGNALFRYARKEQYVDTVAFGAYRKQVFEEIGLLDEDLLYNEDDEFNYRLRQSGGRIFLTPAIRSWYYPRTTLGGLWTQYYRYGRGKVEVIRRYPGTAMTRQFAPITLIATFLMSGVLGAFNPLFRWLLPAVLAAYLSASILFSGRISARHGWKHLPLLPAVFACLHFGYGLGFLVGLLRLVGEAARRRLSHSGH